jgi:DNA recombination protein RmuC
MEYVIGLAVGVILGAAIAWSAASSRTNKSHKSELEALRDELAAEQQIRAVAETKATEADRRIEEQKTLLDEAKQKLTDTFKAVASDTLRDNNLEFIKLSRHALETVLADAKGDLGRREEAIKGLVNPLSDSLKKYEERVSAIEKSRQEAYGGLEQYLNTLTQSNSQLQKETANLVTALRRPQVRGRWGEMTLKRVVELAGLVEHCDFVEQVTVDAEDKRLRPDTVIHLPSGRDMVVDTKTPLDAYLDATAAATEEARKEALDRHAKQVRSHMTTLAGKEYWKQFPHAPEFVVMFIPGESFFAEAADRDHTLIEDGLEKRVIPATPTTLIALLRAVAYGWRQEELEKNALEISELGRQLYERMKVLVGHIDAVGKGLASATTSYNRAVASLESRVLPSARRFQELGVATGGDKIEQIRTVDIVPRGPAVPELPEVSDMTDG